MKRFPFVLVCLAATFFANAQNVGIGTPTPDASALLHVDLGTSTTKGLLITGTYNGASTIPNLGAGSRMMFYPGKAAFRAGYVGGSQWDNVNVGVYSIAMGQFTTASGNGSTAMGVFTTASGAYSTAMGNNTIASGDNSFAIGVSSTASGYSSIAMGGTGQANTDYSVAIGESVRANSWSSISLGRQNDPIVTSPTIGWILNEPLLIVGNGTGPSDKKNAFAIAKNGNIYIDPSNKNDGTLTGNTLLFGTFNGAGEGISSKRTAGGNQFGLDFYTSSANRMSITNGGNVGIGISTPAYPLTFAQVLGDKFSLFGNAGGHYGMGIQSFLMQIYSDASNSDIAFGYGSSSSFTENMRIKGNGNVGIGTSNPQKNLSVQNGMNVDQADINTGSVVNAITFGINSGEGIGSKRNAGGNQWGLDFYTGAANRMSITNSGNVGIGTTSPAAKLHISAVDASVALFGPNSFGGRLAIGATPINQTTASTAQVIASDGNLHIDPASGKNIYVGYFQARDIYLDPNGGKVGIGTASPAYILDVTGNTGITGNFVNTSTLSNSSGLSGICNNTPNSGYGVSAEGGAIGVLAQAHLAGAGNRYGIYGIGANGANNYGVYSSSSGGVNDFGISATSSGGSGSNYGVYGSASGGDVAYGIYGTASGATSNYGGFFIGDVFCTGIYNGSDRKLKNDIKPLNDALLIIDQLKPSTYTFKTNEYKQMNLPEGLQYGLIADEVLQVVPGAVKKAVQPAEYENHDVKKGKKLSDEIEFNAVNYTEMIPILIAGMKEQQAIITGLQKQIDELRKRVQQRMTK